VSPRGKKAFIIYFGTLACFAADQVTKFWVTAAFRMDETLDIVPNYFAISLKMNPGAAFGLFRSKPLTFFLVVSAIALCFIGYFVIRVDPRRIRLISAMTLILGGALGNISDRLRMGAVVDFIDFHYYETIWPTFNVADVWIIFGVFLFLWDMIENDMQIVPPGEGGAGFPGRVPAKPQEEA